MEGIYEIRLGDRPVGTAAVTREGLYYRFQCRCRLETDSVCKVEAGDVRLGVLVPEGEEFVLNTRLPIKRFPEKLADFRIRSDRPVLQGRFIPIKPEEPFAYIERLKDAYLTRQEGQVGIVLRDPV